MHGTEIIICIVMPLTYLGLWALAFRWEMGRWPKGWERFPH